MFNSDLRRHRPDALRRRWRRWPSMGAEAFRGAGRAHADRRPRHHRPRRRRRRRRRCSGTATPTSFGVIVADNFGLFVTLVLVIVGILTIMFSSQVVRARRHAEGRVLRAGAVLDRRHDHDGDGERPAGHLHRARDPVARRLRADRHPARRRRGRPRRRSSTSCSARFRARSSSTASRSPTASPAARGSIASARSWRRSR